MGWDGAKVKRGGGVGGVGGVGGAGGAVANMQLRLETRVLCSADA